MNNNKSEQQFIDIISKHSKLADKFVIMYSKLLVIQAILYLISYSNLLVNCQVQSSSSILSRISEPLSDIGQFPGVSRDVSALCSGRPSLPINLASMIVHVKRNISFNYKLYLFSNDYVIQTGQIVPRDDFRVHSFPVKIKNINEFWPIDVAIEREGSVEPVTKLDFHFDSFFSMVPMNPSTTTGTQTAQKPKRQASSKRIADRRQRRESLYGNPPEELSDLLPGDTDPPVTATSEKRTTEKDDRNPNESIKFDRDDEVSLLSVPSPNKLQNSGAQVALKLRQDPSSFSRVQASSMRVENTVQGTSMILPVGSFSSFQIDTSYFVRKDFGQKKSQLIKVIVNGDLFRVEKVFFISELNGPRGEDYQFLNHDLLTDPDTRITAITQIYEGWISRNYYTIVYTQRRSKSSSRSSRSNTTEYNITIDRLVFRGSSTTILGADQLGHGVKAAAFITEKNGLHYFFEFISESNKFHLNAVDWSNRPFKIIDSERLSIKASQSFMDNEELLLCPPAVCYSDQPIDEIVAYGRIPLNETIQQQVDILTGVDSVSTPSETINLDKIIDTFKSQANQLKVKLHLRDWMWDLTRDSNLDIQGRRVREIDSLGTFSDKSEVDKIKNQEGSFRPFSFRYAQAQRSDIRTTSDVYGYGLTGHEIEASFRVFNILYLVSVS